MKRRNKIYRNDGLPDLIDKNVILVDDGCATGADMKAAILAVKELKAGHITVAVPVASDSAYSCFTKLPML